MKRLLMGALVAGALTLGLTAPAGATTPSPPQACTTPGWGGNGGPKGGYAAHIRVVGDIPGSGTGDQNHTHCGPPGLAKKSGF